MLIKIFLVGFDIKDIFLNFINIKKERSDKMKNKNIQIYLLNNLIYSSKILKALMNLKN